MVSILFLIILFLLQGRLLDADVKRHFNGEESFDTGPMAPASEPSVLSKSSNLETERTGTKL